MPVSLMNLLGIANALIPQAGDEPRATLPEMPEGGFGALMATLPAGEISAGQLRQFFADHGKGVEGVALLSGAKQRAAGVVDKLLPDVSPEMVMAMQEWLPAETVAFVVQEIWAGAPDLLAGLPEREITAQELVEIVERTGLAPVAVFQLLQETPAASPKLAVEILGAVAARESGVAPPPLPSSALLSPAPQVAGSDVSQMNNEVAPKALPLSSGVAGGDRADALVNEPGGGRGERPADAGRPPLTEAQRQALQHVVDVLQGKVAADVVRSAEVTPAMQQVPSQAQMAKAAVEAATVATVASGGREVATEVKPREKPAAVKAVEMAAADVVKQVTPIVRVQAKERVVVAPPSASSAQPQVAAQAAAKANAFEPLPQQNQTSQPVVTAAAVEQVAQAAKSAHAAGVAPQRSALPGEPVANQVAVRLTSAIHDGATRMEVRLTPAELGRVDVRIDTDSEGRSRVMVTADRRETLEMLHRDARVLERALQDAGIKTENGSLSFNLRGDQNHQQAKQGGQSHGEGSEAGAQPDRQSPDEIERKLTESEMALTYDAERGYSLTVEWGVDISV